MMKVHRFHNRMAVYPPDGPTFYLEREDAEKLALLLLQGSEDIANCKFTHSTFNPPAWQEKEKTS